MRPPSSSSMPGSTQGGCSHQVSKQGWIYMEICILSYPKFVCITLMYDHPVSHASPLPFKPAVLGNGVWHPSVRRPPPLKPLLLSIVEWNRETLQHWCMSSDTPKYVHGVRISLGKSIETSSQFHPRSLPHSLPLSRRLYVKFTRSVHFCELVSSQSLYYVVQIILVGSELNKFAPSTGNEVFWNKHRKLVASKLHNWQSAN